MQTSTRLLGLACLGGALWGGVDGARILLSGRLFLVPNEKIFLVIAGVLGGAVLATLAAVPLLLLKPDRAGRVGLLTGSFALTAAAIGEQWFTDPPPFQKPFFMQGNPIAFLVILLGFGGLVYGLQRLKPFQIALLQLASLGIWSLVAWQRAPTPESPLPAGAPNVLFVTLDTSRADRFGAYGNKKVDTRFFDTVAKEGALFQNATAVAAVTGPSHTSMLSGSGPWDHGVLLNGVPLPTDRPLISEVLRDHGWATGAFVSAYVLDGSLGFSRGFGTYDDDFAWFRGARQLLPVRLSDMAHRHADPDDVLARRAGDTVDQALQWIGAQRGAWFAWVHLFDAHGPYDPPPPYDTRYYQGDPRDPANTSMQQVGEVASYLKPSLAGITDLNYVLAQYEGEISYADSQVGRLLSSVPTRDTLVVLMGDHGESLGEHGVWFNHGDDVYETSVHVPYAIRWPGRVQAGLEVKTPVEGTDVAPTILELVGVAAPATMTGHSDAKLLQGQSDQPRMIAHSMCFDRQANLAERQAGRITAPRYRMVGLRGATSRYVQRELDGAHEYYALSSDPSGLTDVTATTAQTPEGAQLLEILKGQANDLLSGHASDRSAVDVSAEERERLEALGYLQQ